MTIKERKAEAFDWLMTETERQPFEELAAEDRTRAEEARRKYDAERGELNEDHEHDEHEKEEKGGRKKRGKKSPDAPKGTRNAYMFFSPAERKRLVEGGMDQKEALLQAAQHWRDMSEEQKRPYTIQAEADQARYAREMSIYKGEGEAEEVTRENKATKTAVSTSGAKAPQSKSNTSAASSSPISTPKASTSTTKASSSTSTTKASNSTPKAPNSTPKASSTPQSQTRK